MKSVQTIMLSDVDTATVTGAAFNVNQIVSASFCPIFGDTGAVGVVKIQCSNDPSAPSGGVIQNTFVPTNWSDIPNATSAITAGVGSAIVIPNMCFNYIRVVYNRTSGGSTTVKVYSTLLSI